MQLTEPQESAMRLRPSWFLVKTNWPATKTRVARYAGLGGDVWPFDSDGTTEKRLRDLHSRMEHSRTIVDVGVDTAFVCTSSSIAQEYFGATKEHFDEAWLLRASLPGDASSEVAGFDIGFASGGYSVIEQELITERRDGPSLNPWGLIKTLPEALAYFDERRANPVLEHVKEITIIGIEILHEHRRT